MTAAAVDSPHRRAAEPPSVEAHSASRQIQHASQAEVGDGHEHGPDGTLARRCKRCGGAILAQDPRKTGAKPQYCSDACRTTARNERLGRTPVSAAAVRTCQRCGTEFSGRGGTAKFCSDECRDLRWTERLHAQSGKRQAAARRPRRRRFTENPEWHRPAAESHRLASHLELQGRLRAIDRAVYARAGSGCN